MAGKILGYDYTTMLWAPYGPLWRNHRRIASTEILSSHRLNLLVDIRADEVRSLVKRLCEIGGDKGVVIKEALFELTSNVMMRMIAGKRIYGEAVESTEANNFRQVVKELMETVPTSAVDFFPFLKYLGVHKSLEKRLKSISVRFKRLYASMESDHGVSTQSPVQMTRELKGKYYLADGGYGDRKGFMPPFRKVRYHLKEYTNNPPENEKELFNLRHSSLRMCVERAFGVLKKRFRVLDAEPFWPFKTQVDVVLACCVIHNYLRGIDPNDPIAREVDMEMNSQDARAPLTRREVREETKECVKKRNAISLVMWTAYKAYKKPRTM
ncbi:hypothetical protein SOVF_142290 [Spinacia oleracea]|nr:hypothetical protein SOVF_142290 [Spinacia oleracea]